MLFVVYVWPLLLLYLGIVMSMVNLGHLGKYIRSALESFEVWCWRRMEKISWTDRVRNDEVLHRVKVEGSDFAGLEVACWPLVPKFAGSNSAKAVEFFRAKKSSARLPSEEK